MERITSITEILKSHLEPLVGEIYVKTHFAYYGVFKSNLMFGMYKNGEFYLRATKSTLDTVSKLSKEKHALHKKPFKSKKHFCVSFDFLSHPGSKELLFKIIDEVQQEFFEKHLVKHSQIRNLLNLTISTERLLARVGINSVDELRRVGEVKAFVRLIENGDDVRVSLLYRLYAALNGKLISMVTRAEKRKLLQEANDELYRIGLRRCFDLSLADS